MQKNLTTVRNILTCLLFVVLLFSSIVWVNHIVIEKETNRYYMMDKELEKQTEPFDVEVFGSCHAYTSFNPVQFEHEQGYSAYNLANPSEIIPISYVRMENEFRTRKPKVALVEIWGTSMYNTYVDEESILSSYSPLNVGTLPLTKSKNALIRDFEELDLWNENFPLARFKSRIIDNDLHAYDFHYSFENALKEREAEGTVEHSWLFEEMEDRFTHNGSRIYPEILEEGEEFAEKVEWQENIEQIDVGDEMLEVDDKIMKYVDKIIDLCETSGVKLIFYRAPYQANEIELKQANYLEKYFAERDIPYYDLEKNIEFNVQSDFQDENHLGINGNKKVTEFLGRKVTELLEDESL